MKKIKANNRKYLFNFIFLSILIFAFFVATINTSDAASLYVNGTSGNDANIGDTPATAKMTISSAITDAVDDDTINVADGTYTENLDINKNVNLVGESQVGTIIDGSAKVAPVITVEAGNTVTITKFTIQNGNANNGGGILNDGGTVQVSNSNIKQNTAIGGGGIDNRGSMTITDSNIQQNAAGTGGGILNEGTLTITNSNILQNSADENGGGIWNEGTLNAHFNRIVGNIPDALRNTEDGVVFGKFNWWGSNNPDFATLITGTVSAVDYNPWLVMRFSANPTTIQQRETSLLTANFRYDSNGVYHDPAAGHLPDGTPVTFTTTLGNVGSKSVVHFTTNGIATAVLRADEGTGIAVVSAFADNQDPLIATVTIVKAATQVKAANTIGMQETGTPITGIALAILMILGGILTTRKK